MIKPAIDEHGNCLKCAAPRLPVGTCRNCDKLRKAAWKKTEKGLAAEQAYRDRNAEELRARARAKPKSNEARARAAASKRVHTKKPEARAKRAEYLARPEVAKRRNELRAIARQKRYRTDPSFKARTLLASLIRRSVRSGKGGQSWTTMVGFDLPDFLAHFERQFTKGMSWEAFLDGSIHIDHIVPIAAFNIQAIGDAEFCACWSLSNLRPMWAKDNQEKNCKRVFLV